MVLPSKKTSELPANVSVRFGQILLFHFLLNKGKISHPHLTTRKVKTGRWLACLATSPRSTQTQRCRHWHPHRHAHSKFIKFSIVKCTLRRGIIQGESENSRTIGVTLGLTINTENTGILYYDAMGDSSGVNQHFYKKSNSKQQIL